MSMTKEAQAVQAVLDRLEFKKRHTDDCQTTNNITEWQRLGDKRKRCACPIWSCGVHDRSEGFKRRSTGENAVERAVAVVKLRLETGNRAASLPTATATGTPISEAVADFMAYTKSGGAEESTMKKYQTLMDQLQAFSAWKGFRYVHELTQDAVIEFRRSWEDPKAGYKEGRTRKDGYSLWRGQGIGTCKRNAKTLHQLFKRGITRKWEGITEDPTSILQFPKDSAKTKETVKYLTPEQFAALMVQCDTPSHMPEYNRHRLKALILTMRWAGLRISDAVVLKDSDIKDGTIFKTTKKASTPVQIPLHPALVNALAKLKPYSGGYLFWNKQTEGSDPATPESNFSKLLADLFRDAGIVTDMHHVSHMLRNTFAVDLLEGGAALPDVSLMLGHKSVKTTELYYADFTDKYMGIAADKIRKLWALPDKDETPG